VVARCGGEIYSLPRTRLNAVFSVGNNQRSTLNVRKSQAELMAFMRQFMMIHASTNAPLFRTGWLVESLATQTLVVFVMRTAGKPFRSRPGGRLLIAVAAVSLAGAVLPYTRLAAVLGFVALPPSLPGVISILALVSDLGVSGQDLVLHRHSFNARSRAGRQRGEPPVLCLALLPRHRHTPSDYARNSLRLGLKPITER
jgi:hypothetical protein